MNFKHGHKTKARESPTHVSWRAMRQRCENRRHRAFDYYGGRGIRVCDRWRSFKLFLEDMGERPSREHTLDRINSDGPYEPGNCRWSDWRQQRMNHSDQARRDDDPF